MEAVHDEGYDLRLRTSQEPPDGGICAVPICIGAENGRGITTGIDSEREQLRVRSEAPFLAEPLLKRLQR